MELTDAWTGRTACALQAALRLTNETFAGHLGIAVRTVAAWHQKPELTPKAEMQQLLDTALQQASDAARARFTRLASQQESMPLTLAADAPSEGYVLRVAVAIVVREQEVLIVCRRGEAGGGISWQFPAGVVKPGVTPETVAVRETLAETAVHCAMSRRLGGRLHPITQVYCDYVLCEYLTGDAQNLDVVENVGVVWANKAQLTRFIPAERIYPPILEALEVAE